MATLMKASTTMATLMKAPTTKALQALQNEARALATPGIRAETWRRVDRGQALTEADKRSIRTATTKLIRVDRAAGKV